MGGAHRGTPKAVLSDRDVSAKVEIRVFCKSGLRLRPSTSLTVVTKVQNKVSQAQDERALPASERARERVLGLRPPVLAASPAFLHMVRREDSAYGAQGTAKPLGAGAQPSLPV